MANRPFNREFEPGTIMNALRVLGMLGRGPSAPGSADAFIPGGDFLAEELPHFMGAPPPEAPQGDPILGFQPNPLNALSPEERRAISAANRAREVGGDVEGLLPRLAAEAAGGPNEPVGANLRGGDDEFDVDPPGLIQIEGGLIQRNAFQGPPHPRPGGEWVPLPSELEQHDRRIVPGLSRKISRMGNRAVWEQVRRDDEKARRLPAGEGMTFDERFGGVSEDLIQEILRGDVEAQMAREGRGPITISGLDTPEEVDAQLAENFPDLAEGLEGEPLGPFTTRRKFDVPQGAVVRVPPQLRGHHGFTDEPIQMVSPEQAENMRQWMAELAELDAVQTAEDSGILQGGTLADVVAPTMSGEDALRYVRGGVSTPGTTVSPSDVGYGRPGGALFDARFHGLKGGDVVKRADHWTQRQAAYEAGKLELSPREIRRLSDPVTGEGFGIRPEDRVREEKFFDAMQARKDTKAKRLATRSRLKRERYGGAGGGRNNFGINVPRFWGESDAAYAQRYSSMAGVLGQAMGGGQGDFGAMLNFMAQMMGNEQSGQQFQQQQNVTTWTTQLAMMEQQLQRMGPGMSHTAPFIKLQQEINALRSRILRVTGS